MYGTQASANTYKDNLMFENDVKMYGTQAENLSRAGTRKFENDVKVYGTQAILIYFTLF